MTTTVAILGGVAAAAAAAVWPYLPKIGSNTLSPAERAAWVNRLFLLVDAAEQAGEAQVAANARALISSLVVPQEAPKRGR